jgi:hypothetical protein
MRRVACEAAAMVGWMAAADGKVKGMDDRMAPRW